MTKKRTKPAPGMHDDATIDLAAGASPTLGTEPLVGSATGSATEFANEPANEPALVARTEGGGTQAIDRALAVLFSFTQATPERRVNDLTRDLGLNKSTVYRLLQALGNFGLVRRNDDNGSYRLGPAVLDLANCFLSNVDLGTHARPFLQAFAMDRGETVNVAVLDGSEAIKVYDVRGSKTPQLVSRHGLRIPVYCSAAGKALVLDMPDAQVRELLSRSPMERVTPRTLIDPDEFVRRLAQWRQQGWTLNDEESEIGMRVIGAPVRDHTGGIVAAVSVSAPTFRLHVEDVAGMAEALLEVAGRISESMGAAQAPR